MSFGARDVFNADGDMYNFTLKEGVSGPILQVWKISEKNAYDTRLYIKGGEVLDTWVTPAEGEGSDTWRAAIRPTGDGQVMVDGIRLITWFDYEGDGIYKARDRNDNIAQIEGVNWWEILSPEQEEIEKRKAAALENIREAEREIERAMRSMGFEEDDIQSYILFLKKPLPTNLSEDQSQNLRDLLEKRMNARKAFFSIKENGY